MVVRRDARIAFATVLTLGLCAAITAPARTSSATYGTGGVGTATVGGSGTLGTGGTTNRAATPNASGGRLLVNVAVPTESTATASGGIGKTTSASSASSGVAGGAARASAGVVAPVGLDAGAVRPTWHEAEVVLTVDPSYLALPYAKRALEGALLAWTTMADQLPRVTLRYADEALSSQSAQENLTDHRIFFAPASDKRANGALAITLVTADEDKNAILDADILVNGGHLFTDVNAPKEGQSASVAYDLQDVITHELGHWFGLDEDYANAEATMYAYVYPRETKKRDLDQSDVIAVQLAYWQADNPNENRGCSVGRSTHTPWGAIGWMAVMSFLVGKRNRRSKSHVPGRPCRLHA